MMMEPVLRITVISRLVIIVAWISVSRLVVVRLVAHSQIVLIRQPLVYSDSTEASLLHSPLLYEYLTFFFRQCCICCGYKTRQE